MGKSAVSGDGLGVNTQGAFACDLDGVTIGCRRHIGARGTPQVAEGSEGGVPFTGKPPVVESLAFSAGDARQGGHNKRQGDEEC